MIKYIFIPSTLLLLFLFTSCNYNKTVELVNISITELEESIIEEYLENGWDEMRREWIELMHISDIIQTTAESLIMFESFIRWSAFDDNWRNNREIWIEKLTYADSNPEVAHLLVELEKHILPNSLKPNWIKVRKKWARKLKRF